MRAGKHRLLSCLMVDLKTNTKQPINNKMRAQRLPSTRQNNNNILVIARTLTRSFVPHQPHRNIKWNFKGIFFSSNAAHVMFWVYTYTNWEDKLITLPTKIYTILRTRKTATRDVTPLIYMKEELAHSVRAVQSIQSSSLKKKWFRWKI